MGFIDWHGKKEDQYEDILAFAKMKEKLDADNFGSQVKKKEAAVFFGVQELLPMESSEILKLLLKEKKSMDMLYEHLVQQALLLQTHITMTAAEQFYHDFWRYSIDVLFQQAKLDEKRMHQFADLILKKIFKVNNRIPAEEHYQRIASSDAYRQYLSRGFELKSGKVTLFWQWIRYLSDLLSKKKEGIQLIRLYQRFMMQLAYYISQMIPDAGIGRRYAERKQINEMILQKSFSSEADLADLEKNMRNPIFEIYAEEEKKKQEALEAQARYKKRLSLMKCARVIPGYYIFENEDERDMITAAKLYSEIKEKQIKLDRMVSIFPAESADLLKRGSLPVISNKDVHFRLNAQEVLHYVEYVSLYMQRGEEEPITEKKGTLFVTSQRIQLEAGGNVYSVSYEYLKKAVIYDVMPEMIELASAEENYFIRTADTEFTYQIIKKILNCWMESDGQENADSAALEQLTIGFLEKENLEIYIFGIKQMMEAMSSKKLSEDMADMVRSLEYLDLALKKYPDCKKESHSFLAYYIPEAVKIFYAYHEYEKAGVEQQEMNPLHRKAAEAIRLVSAAAKQQVANIYKKAIVDTNARAEALTEILGQDGYVDPAYKITL